MLKGKFAGIATFFLPLDNWCTPYKIYEKGISHLRHMTPLAIQNNQAGDTRISGMLLPLWTDYFLMNQAIDPRKKHRQRDRNYAEKN
jgi:hypothetical protein